MNDKIEMAQIPYIEHKQRLFSMYLKKRKWIWAFAVSNILWTVIVLILLMR